MTGMATPKLRLTLKLNNNSHGGMPSAAGSVVGTDMTMTSTPPAPSMVEDKLEMGTTPPIIVSSPPKSKKAKVEASQANQGDKGGTVGTGEGSTTFVTPFKKERGRPKKSTLSRPTPAVEVPPSAEQMVETIVPGATGAELRPPVNKVQFPEQVAFVREMGKFRTRKWSSDPIASITLLNGRILRVPAWVRDLSASSSVSRSPSRSQLEDDAHAGSAGLAASSTHIAPPIIANGLGGKRIKELKFSSYVPTFVCTQEGCHKIFDARDKWRRHMAHHKKKLIKLDVLNGSPAPSFDVDNGSQQPPQIPPKMLSLKLNMGAMKAAAAAHSASLYASPQVSSTVATSCSEIDADQSDLDLDQHSAPESDTIEL